MSSTQENIQANIEGNVSGQIAIGSYILQVGDINGGVVNIAPPSARPGFEPRSRPIDLRPRAFPGLLDRTQETELIQTAIAASRPVALFGENGIGKTSLLRQVAHLPELKGFADGAVYLLLHGEEIEDLLQVIFDAFYVSTDNQKPTEGQLRNDLKEIQALIILDDIFLKREDADFLLDAMPKSLFILASTERSLWGDGQAVPLDGLPEAEALGLFERELGRSLTDDERPAAIQICTVLLFHPLRILQAASTIREEKLSVLETFSRLTKTRTQSPVLEVTLKNSNETQKKILSLLAVAGGFVLTREHLTALVSSASFEADMKSLIGRGFVQAEGSGFSLGSEALSSLTQIWNLSGWEDALLNHFSNWVKTSPQDMLVDQVADTLFHLIKRAGEKKDWPHVVALGKVIERFYLLRKKWQGWLKILELLRMAAKALMDRKLEGWVLHQMGSRALSMGAKESAQEFLKQALNIRHAIGDKAGLAVTQHNMNILLGVPVPAKPGKPDSLRRWLTCGAIGAVAGFLFVTAAVGATMLFPFGPTDTPTPTITSTLPVKILTLSPTPTTTPSPRPTPVVLFDFVEDANLARWEAYYPNPDGVSQVDLTFYNEPPSPSLEDFANANESSYAGLQPYPVMEDGSKEDELALLTYPYYGSIVRGTYNLFDISLQSGDRFEARIGYKALPAEIKLNSTYVTYSVYFYEKDPESRILLDTILELYDGKVQDWVIPIPKNLIGKRGFFVLEVSSLNNHRYDWTVWLDAALMGLPR